MMQQLSLRFFVKKSATFTTILRVKKCHFHYDMQKKSYKSLVINICQFQDYLKIKCILI
jgi:hypothetical protein